MQSLRTPSGKQSGGQVGHEGTTLRQVESPEAVCDQDASTCGQGGAGVAAEARTGYQKRQVVELPAPPPLQGTEHRAHRSWGAQCGSTTQAAFPAEVTAAVQSGRSLRALVGYWPCWQLISEDRVAELLRDGFRVDLATATIAALSHKQAAELAEVAATIERQVAQAPVKPLDETGLRLGGLTHWLHVASPWGLTGYRLSRQRGAM